MSNQSMEPDPPPSAASRRSLRWGRRLGVAAFLFFLLKGLAWLVVPAVIAYWAAS